MMILSILSDMLFGYFPQGTPVYNVKSFGQIDKDNIKFMVLLARFLSKLTK